MPGRATVIEIAAVPVRVASLADVIRANGQPGDRATWRCWRFWSSPMQKRLGRRARLAAVARENARAVRDLIRRGRR